MKKESYNEQTDFGQKLSLKDNWEMDYWCNRLHTTPPILLKVIKKVGYSLDAIKKELNK